MSAEREIAAEDSIRVVCRFRPLNDSEEKAGSKVIVKFPNSQEENCLSIGVSICKWQNQFRMQWHQTCNAIIHGALRFLHSMLIAAFHFLWLVSFLTSNLLFCSTLPSFLLSQFQHVYYCEHSRFNSVLFISWINSNEINQHWIIPSEYAVLCYVMLYRDNYEWNTPTKHSDKSWFK